MTEKQWFTCKDPQLMFDYLRNETTIKRREKYLISERKMELFVNACCIQYGVNTKDIDFKQAETWMLVWCSTGFTDIRCDILRDIVGNPFKSYKYIREECWDCKDDPQFKASRRCKTCNGKAEIFVNWLTTNVISIAQQIYNTKNFDNLPILGDALLDAGCADEYLLKHCHGTRCQHYSLEMGINCKLCFGTESRNNPETQLPMVHFLGCWVIDSILGKN